MNTKTKSDYLQIRVTAAEKTEIEQAAKEAGLDTISAYMLWLFRNRKKI